MGVKTVWSASNKMLRGAFRRVCWDWVVMGEVVITRGRAMGLTIGEGKEDLDEALSGTEELE